MLIGYIRVSKSDGSQVLDLQRDALEAAGVAPDRTYQDLASGRKDGRPGLVACMKALQPGNTLVIWKLDRLGRDLKYLVNIVDALSQRGIGLKVLAGTGAWASGGAATQDDAGGFEDGDGGHGGPQHSSLQGRQTAP
jgi:DNA invertase Pin-like site-specific DNA recombinase